MATYYWVGGTGTWNSTSTTNWATSSGGSGGAGVPTSADDVVFDDNSNTGTDPFTVTVTGTSAAPAVCNNFSTSSLDGAMTLTMGATAFLDCYGSMTFPVTNFSTSGTDGSTIRFRATTTGKTFTTNGVNINNIDITFDGVGGGWTLGSALTGNDSSSFTINNGTFNTGNYNITARQFISNTSNTRTIILGSSTITLSIGGNTVAFVSTNLTFNPGTSIFNLSNLSAGFNGDGLTFYDLSFTSSAISAVAITGTNTFNNLTFPVRVTDGSGFVNLSADQTINGTFAVQSGNTDPTKRIRFNSNVLGTARTITTATINFGSGIDFRDITAAGTASPFDISALQGGDCGGNTNITFSAPKIVYRIGTGNFSAIRWATTSGGTPAANQFPLAQDTMVFDANTTTGTHTINASYNFGSLDMTNSTTVTLASGTTAPTFYGSITLGSNVTMSGTGTLTFLGRSTQTITSNGRSFTQGITISPINSSVVLADDMSVPGFSVVFSLSRGILDLNDKILTVFTFASDNTNTRSITFGTNGKIRISGGTFPQGNDVWQCQNLTNFSCTGSKTVELISTSSTGFRRFYHGGIGGSESNAVSFNIVAGSDQITVGVGATSNVLNIDFTGFSGTWDNGNLPINIYGNLIMPAGITLATGTGAISFTASFGAQTITTNGKILDFPITKSGVGTLQLVDNLTMGSTRTFTLTQGTINLNGKTLTTGTFSSTGSTARSINMNYGKITCAASGTAFNVTGSNFSTTGLGTINMSSNSAKTFAGNGYQNYPTLNQGGSGNLTITGSNKFYNITNTVYPSTIIFPSNTVTKLQNLVLRGKSGNLVTLQSSTPGTKYTLTYEP